MQTNSPKSKVEKDVIMYKAYIAQRKYGVVLDGINSAHPDELQAVKMFADYLSNQSKRYSMKFITLNIRLYMFIFL